MLRLLSVYLSLHAALVAAVAIEGRVVAVDQESRHFEVEVSASSESSIVVGETKHFRVATGDLEIGYMSRRIRANASYYGNAWHLEQVFPLDGIGAKAMLDVNRRLNEATATMSRRKYLKQGQYIPDFAMIDHNGDFLQMRQLRGKAFVLNFIFTRCAVPEMCPASSTRMELLQERARAAGMEDLHFVTISFDPAFDSPGTLRTYAEGYGIELDNFHLLTGTQQLVDNLLRQFGILTIEEDGTINHTMATLLVDAHGRVAYRKEGSSWTVDEFLKAARQL